MKFANTWLKKVLLVLIGSFLFLSVAIVGLISPIAKYLIEKYDEKYTGRQIESGWVYINPFTGYIHISDLRIHESKGLHSYQDGDSLFFSAKGVTANFAMIKLLSKTIEITEITLNQPKGVVLQTMHDFNFNDLIRKFTPLKHDTVPSIVHFNILKIKIINGDFYYQEKLIPIRYFITKVNLESSGKRWDSDSIAVKFSLLSGIGSGDMNGNFMINFKTRDYRLAVVVHKFDLNIIQQYLKDLTNGGTFSANLDADLRARGNFMDPENLMSQGQVAINNFHFGKNPKDDFASFDRLVLAIILVSPKNHQYLFDSVSLDHPYFKYERYDYLDNIQTMFGVKGANITAVAANPAKFNLVIEIARYVKALARNFFQSDYKINRLAIYHGDLKFNDYAISEKFSAGLNPLFFLADSINKNHKRVYASLKTGIQPFGNATVSLSINPNDSLDFDIQYHIQKVPASLFNPYLLSYTSYPLDRGTVELSGSWKVTDGMIKSDNHLLVMDPRRTKRVRNRDKKWIPLPLIMSLVRERGNVIDYQIPITGNLKDPKFHLHDVLADVLENIVVKPATAPYRLDVKNTETEIEKSLTMTWAMRKSVLLANQEKFVMKMADYLSENLEASIHVYPQFYSLKEKEYILFFEAKKKYFLVVNHKESGTFSQDDSVNVDKMSVKDSLFVQYLNKHAQPDTLFTIQEKCGKFVDLALINLKYNRLNEERKMVFMEHFKEKSVDNRVKIHEGESNIPYNGFSFYKVTYKGELPENLTRAYRKMNELNDEAPRKKFKKDRKKSR